MHANATKENMLPARMGIERRILTPVRRKPLRYTDRDSQAHASIAGIAEVADYCRVARL